MSITLGWRDTPLSVLLLLPTPSVLALSTALSVPPLANPKDKDYHEVLLCVCARGEGVEGKPLTLGSGCTGATWDR